MAILETQKLALQVKCFSSDQYLKQFQIAHWRPIDGLDLTILEYFKASSKLGIYEPPL